ncbi:hypothetical protein [Pseudomonas aeruginosa]|uniref:hypothetical protein n=1 Tax=Pseudomonas aeruginosa TaxID=287 RepID=UPI003C307438
MRTSRPAAHATSLTFPEFSDWIAYEGSRTAVDRLEDPDRPGSGGLVERTELLELHGLDAGLARKILKKVRKRELSPPPEKPPPRRRKPRSAHTHR